MQLLLAAVLAAAVALGVPAPAAAAPTSSDHPRTLHVSSTAPGPGDGSAARPYRRISQAVAVAAFGDTHPVGLRASLEVRNTVLRLRSEPRRFVGLEARGGRLEITDSTVTSWAPSAGRPDDLAGDGRAWVLARDGSVMNVTRSRMERLGYHRAERSGVAWRTRRTSGTVSRSVFAGNWDGAHLHGGRHLQIEDNVFRHNARNGMVLAASCANATVRGNQSYANDGHGLVVAEGCNDVTLTGDEVHDNPAVGHRPRQRRGPAPVLEHRLRQRARPPRPRPAPAPSSPTPPA